MNDVLRALRWGWNQLTSMKTALLLLFALALAAIPGSFIPQRPVAPEKVRAFAKDHPSWASLAEKLGLFNVYAAPWFAAIYLLLLISLIGCIIPRALAWVRSLRREPVRVPTNLARLPEHRQADVDADPQEVLRLAADHLRRRRYVVAVTDRGVSAEKGRWREGGNIAFHVGIIAMLAGVAVGTLYGYRGSAAVPVGYAFSNSITQYDELSVGPRVTPRDLAPFSAQIQDFAVEFKKEPPNLGMPLDFRAQVRATTADGRVEERTLAVNHPLEIDGTQVHLMGHGYAADVKVVDAQGKVAFAGPVLFLPQDGNFTSLGVVKAPDARPSRLAFEGILMPTGTVDAQGPHSLFPDALDPQLFVNVWSGPPKAEDGASENVYQLNKTGLTQMSVGGKPVAARLKPGQTLTLPNGQGSLTFVGYRHWVRLQISRTPGLGFTLASFAIALAGLCVSLFVRPRRLFVTASEGSVQVAGLDRTQGRVGLAADVDDLLHALLPDRKDHS